ncbi:TerC/Alx family metal homeostasis membrane protein [Nigerium massiliense]|uniref:TerC/Alx family metal homeostasis membrane protein n=1 Tax=Nigerium massiliense TaxID=1522317 RepID=UPI000694EC12|nr:TerC/Alx family metal homeostasis membrane protein [Nigerium massiliense]
MVSPWVWLVTVIFIIGLLLYDYFFHVRVPHTPTLKEAAIWSAVFVGIALVFGVVVWVFGGSDMGMEYFAGYITEKALSVDNLFVFLIIINGFRVPRAGQQKVLLFGIIFSLITRTAFIFVGAALINSFAWMFYLFGALLIFMAGKQLQPESDDESLDDNGAVRLARRFFHTSDDYDGDKLFTQVDGKRAMTPMLLVMIAIGGTDLLFALDSIPAIFGLTQSTFIVFTATAFSLLGLRQLYFLIDGLLDRLIYLKYGLAAILAFIGAKLILHALHENNVPFINDGEPVPVIEISTGFSLTFILGVLIVTVLASLLSKKGKALTTIKNTRRHAEQYLDLGYEADAQLREGNYRRLLEEERQLRALDDRWDYLIRDEQKMLDLLDDAHREHDRFIQANPQHHTPGKPLRPEFDTAPFREPEADPDAGAEARPSGSD